MAFYDHMGKSALSFGRRTKDKFQSFTETTRLRSLLSGEEKYFHKLCGEIGEQFVRLHSEDYSPDFQELMTLAKESQSRSEGYRSQINSLRRIRPCPNCGAEVPQDYAFCNFCGTALPKVDVPAPRGFVKCPGCNAVIPETMDFCNFCGAEQQAHIAKEAAVVEEREAQAAAISENAQAPALPVPSQEEAPADAAAQEEVPDPEEKEPQEASV